MITKDNDRHDKENIDDKADKRTIERHDAAKHNKKNDIVNRYSNNGI